MSIIGIIWFSLTFLCIVGLQDSDTEGAIGWGFLGVLYALPFSIVCLVKSINSEKSKVSISQELLLLHELKEKGIITEGEFQYQKSELLSK